jgi:hypothetical protein
VTAPPVVRERPWVTREPAQVTGVHADIPRVHARVTRDRGEVARRRSAIPGEPGEVLRAGAVLTSAAPTSLRTLASNRRMRRRFPARDAESACRRRTVFMRGARSVPSERHPMTTRLKPSKSAALTSVQGLISGTLAHFPANTFALGSMTFTTASLVQRLQKLADAIIALNTVQAEAKDALSALQQAQEDVDPVIQAYKRFVFATYFDSTPTLADFLLAPPKVPAPRTVVQKAAAAAKLRATRKARGTTSKKQKLAIKGDVTGVVVTPITSPVAPV